MTLRPSWLSRRVWFGGVQGRAWLKSATAGADACSVAELSLAEENLRLISGEPFGSVSQMIHNADATGITPRLFNGR